MKKLLAVIAISVMAFNTPVFAGQFCEDIAKDYAKNAEEFRNFYPGFMEVIPEPGAEEVYSTIQNFQEIIRKLSVSVRSLQANHCDTIAFFQATYSAEQMEVFVENGQVSPWYCQLINHNSNRLQSYLSDLGGDAMSKDFLMSIYDKAHAELAPPTLQGILYQNDLLDFLGLYMPRDGISAEAIEALTEEQLMNGWYKVRVALRVYQAVTDFQELRKQTFCPAE